MLLEAFWLAQSDINQASIWNQYEDEELTADCARGGGIGGGNGFCYNEFTMEWRPGKF